MINYKKREQRLFCLSKRKLIKEKKKNIHRHLSKQLSKLENFKKAKIVASFISIHTEISTNELNDFLIHNNKILCLPVIKNNLKYLIFRKYDFKTNLIKGKFGILEPEQKNEELLPDLILTPCLAFDDQGYRLGYGGGYYDQTFLRLKKSKHLYKSVAVAFDDQKVTKVFHDKFDQKIDFALTEKKIYRTL